MSETRVVHVKDEIPGSVYIGRNMVGRPASKWKNQFKIGPTSSREEVLEQHSRWIRRSLDSPIRDLPELRGKVLACWCRHDGEVQTAANACHGDTLIWLLDNYTDEELRRW